MIEQHVHIYLFDVFVHNVEHLHLSFTLKIVIKIFKLKT